MGAWGCSGPPQVMCSGAGSTGVPVSLLHAPKPGLTLLRGRGLPLHVLSGLSHTSHMSLVLGWGGLLSSQYDYLGDRRPIPAGMYPYHYPASPTVHDKMVRTLLVDQGVQSPQGGGPARGLLTQTAEEEPLRSSFLGQS